MIHSEPIIAASRAAGFEIVGGGGSSGPQSDVSFQALEDADYQEMLPNDRRWDMLKEPQA